jgi:NADH:ubiquinone oxidoreductase subunit K
MVFYDILFYICILFSISMLGLGFYYNGNLFYFLIFFESCMLSLIVNYVFICILLDDPRCIIYALILFAIAAVESAIGLSLILLYQRSSGHIFYSYSIDG